MYASLSAVIQNCIIGFFYFKSKDKVEVIPNEETLSIKFLLYILKFLLNNNIINKIFLQSITFFFLLTANH